MATSAFELLGKILIDDGGALNKLSNFDNMLKKTETSSNNANKNIVKSVGNTMTAVGTGMVSLATTIGTGAVKAFIPYEETMAKVSTLVSDTAMPRLKKDCLDLSKQLGMDANLIGDAMYQGLSSGVSEQNISDFTQKMGKLAKGGMTDVQTATDLTTTILNAYGMEISETSTIMDRLIQVQNSGKTTVGELGAVMGKTIPTAKAYGVDLDNVSASYALMTKQGISTHETSTYMNAMFNELGKSGTKVSKIIKDETGKSFKELMDGGADLSEVLNVLNEYAIANNLSLGDLFGSAEAAKAGLVLASEGGALFRKELEGMENSAGATDEAFNKMDNTLKSKIDKSLQNIKNTFIRLGEAMLPMIETQILPAIERFTTYISNLDESAMQNIASWVEWGAKIGAVLVVGGQIISIFSSITTATGALSTALGGAGLGGALGLLLNPVTLIVGGLALLGTAFAVNQSECKRSQEAYNELGGNMEDFTGRLKTNHSIWSRLFGEKVDIQFSDQWKTARAETDTEVDGVIAKLEWWSSKVKEIMNDPELDPTTKAEEITNATSETVNAIASQYQAWSTETATAVAQNFETLRNYYMDELGMTEEQANAKAGIVRDYQNSERTEMTQHYNEINGIISTAMAEGRQVTDEELAQINQLWTDAGEHKKNSEKATADDLIAIYNNLGLQERNISFETYAKLSENDRKKVQSSNDWVKQFEANAKANMQKSKELENTDSQLSDSFRKNADKNQAIADFFKTKYQNVMDSCISSGQGWDSATNSAMQSVISALKRGDSNLEQFGIGSVDACAMVIQSMAESGASAGELESAIKQIPKEWQSAVMSKVTGKSDVDNLKRAIDNVKSRDIYVNTYTTTYRRAVEMEIFKGSEGVLPKRAYGDENFRDTATAMVGEQGAEIVELPRGAKVKTHRETKNTIEGNNQPTIIQIFLDGDDVTKEIGYRIGGAISNAQRKYSL